eukprot:IDg17107t1
MKITRADRAANFVENCPVWRYPEGLDYPLYALYTTNGFIPGGAGLPLSADSDCDREIAARSNYTGRLSNALAVMARLKLPAIRVLGMLQRPGFP